jgi:hypothetical protein
VGQNLSKYNLIVVINQGIKPTNVGAKRSRLRPEGILTTPSQVAQRVSIRPFDVAQDSGQVAQMDTCLVYFVKNTLTYNVMRYII